MKKLISTALIIQLLIIAIFSLPCANAADDEEFIVKKGVLIAYNGTSSDVTIPTDVYYIGDSAFENNSKVKTVALHSGVYYIGDRAFYNCSLLEAVKGSSSVNSVGDSAFFGTPFYTNNKEAFMTVGNVLVKHSGSEATLSIPTKVTAIAPDAFSTNKALTSVVIPDGVVQIGKRAFSDCTGLSSIKIPNTVTTIGSDAFKNTRWLSDYKDDFVIEGNGILIKYKGSFENVLLPASVKVIAPSAFAGNTHIKKAVLSDSTYLIGANAFDGCSALSAVSFGKNTYFIDEKAFANSAIETAVLPRSLKSLGAGAFENCKSLSYARIFDNVLEIPQETFAGCESLTGISIPSTVRTINQTAFKNSRNVVFYIPNDSYAKIYADILEITTRNMKGDVNGDNKVTIADATLIQKYMAEISSLAKEQLDCADMNVDGKVAVNDATEIQRFIAS